MSETYMFVWSFCRPSVRRKGIRKFWEFVRRLCNAVAKMIHEAYVRVSREFRWIVPPWRTRYHIAILRQVVSPSVPESRSDVAARKLRPWCQWRPPMGTAAAVNLILRLIGLPCWCTAMLGS